jgi:hypothetical protein
MSESPPQKNKGEVEKKRERERKKLIPYLNNRHMCNTLLLSFKPNQKQKNLLAFFFCIRESLIVNKVKE